MRSVAAYVLCAAFALASHAGYGNDEPAISEADFLTASFPKGDMTEFLKQKKIDYRCDLRRNEAIAKRFTGFIAFCNTTSEWTRPPGAVRHGHHNVTRIKWVTQYKDGIVNGINLVTGDATKNYDVYIDGRLQLAVFKNAAGKLERKSYPDCLPILESKLLPVPKERQFVAVHAQRWCEEPTNSVYRVRADCISRSEGRLYLYNHEGKFASSYAIKNGVMQGIAYEFAKMFKMENDREVAYAFFDPLTCRVQPEGDPKKRTKAYNPKLHNPSAMYLPLYRPDREESERQRRNVSLGVSTVMMPFIYLGSPILIWVAPGLYPNSHPTASATYMMGDSYWEWSLGILSFSTRDWSTSGGAFHYTYKKIDDHELWGLRLAAGAGTFIFFGSVQAGIAFERSELAQASLDLCALPLLSVCFGPRIPLKEKFRDLEAPLQLSLKLGF